jgi:hypothetical protein
MSKIFVGLGLIIGLLLMAQTSGAWEQGTHRQINYEAVQVFLSQIDEHEKFQWGPITERTRRQPYRGIAVASSSMFKGDFKLTEGHYTMPQWIVLGGDWADEPHLYASVRHFYDPLRKNLPGVSYLLDQYWAHGVLYESPGIDARKWGLDHEDNPFSYKQGLIYYKLAMEVSEDSSPGFAYSQDHFKLKLNLAPVNHEDQRGIYLALAYRALGEAMHMLGDMTQPAHVRNDSHPMDEPIETRTYAEHVRQAAASPFLDGRITPYLASAGGTLQRPETLFHEVAGFVNRHFYSADTIANYRGSIMTVAPNNYDAILAHPYASPIFSDLKEEDAWVQGYLVKRKVLRYAGKGGVFERTHVPMIQERLSFHWFDPDESFFIDPLEAAASFQGAVGRYHIPNAFAPKQSKVLLPMAIYSNVDLMYMFFPTLQLTAEFSDEGIKEGHARGQSDYHRYVIHVDADMTHLQHLDTAWSDYGLKIDYSGPGTLVISENGKVVKKHKLQFKKGKLDKIGMPDGSFAKKDLELYSPLGDRTLTQEEAYFAIQTGQSLHVEVEAGTRLFKSDSWMFEKEEIDVTIQPPRIMTYELKGGATEVTHEFEAYASPDDTYRFEWEFGNGKTATETVSPGQTSKVTNTYTGLKDGDVFYPKVKIYSMSGFLLAEDSITIKIEESGEEVNVSILSEPVVFYNLQTGSTEVSHLFQAIASVEGFYIYEWFFGDGRTTRQTIQPGETSGGYLTYSNLKDGDEFRVQLNLYNQSEELLASDSITIKIRITGRFVPMEDGVFWDTQTNLVWGVKIGSYVSWPFARDICQNYSAGGNTNWRMPSLSELEGLYNAKSAWAGGMNYTNLLWTSDTGVDGEGRATAIMFNINDGARSYVRQTGSYSAAVLPVRTK